MHQNDILQQEASVAMLKIMVNTGRAKRAELQAAEAILAQMKGEVKPVETVVQHIAKPHIDHRVAVVPITSPGVDMVETVFRRKGELMTKIKRLTAEQNELSNTLHTVPENQDCPGLTKQIVSLRRKIEGYWTEYRFIERNGLVPKREAENDVDDDPEREIKLLRIATSLRRLRDKRLKLENKLEKPHLHTKNPEMKIPEWQTELIQVLEEISELEYQKEQFYTT